MWARDVEGVGVGVGKSEDSSIGGGGGSRSLGWDSLVLFRYLSIGCMLLCTKY